MTEPAAVFPPEVPVVAAPQPQPLGPQRRALGATGFVLSLLAFLGDFVIILVLVGTIISAIGHIGGYLQGQGSGGFGGDAAAFVGALIAGVVGTLLAIVGVILGSIAAARNRGRVLGIFAIILGGLVILTRILVIVALASSSSGNS